VARELSALGEQPRPEDGGVAWSGDARSVLRANLWLRTASRVLVRVARFNARSFAELERHAKRIPWSDFLADGATPEFRVTSHKSKLLHTGAIEERLATAIGVRSRSQPGNGDGEPATQLFIVRVVRDEFEVSADASGELLHVRGYRQAVGKAPLRETLAAALLLAAEWDGETPLVDPFCGSGTIPIEAAMIARRLAPGVGRGFSANRWPGFATDVWRGLVADARSRERPRAPAPIAGSDRDAGAIESARANAARAGVAGDIEFTRQAVSSLVAPLGVGLVACNPPYGARVSAGADLRNLYARFGDTLRRACPGWRVAFYAAHQRMARETKLASRELLRTSNGGIRIAAWAAQVGPATGR